MPRKPKLRVASAGEALDAFEVAWNRAREGGRDVQEDVIGFANLPLLLATLTPARWTLLRRLRESGPSSVNALAKLLVRDYKNVHTDVRALADLGLVARREDGLVEVAWDRISAEFRL
jgi:predicted transcriptional regulator